MKCGASTLTQIVRTSRTFLLKKNNNFKKFSVSQEEFFLGSRIVFRKRELKRVVPNSSRIFLDFENVFAEEKGLREERLT